MTIEQRTENILKEFINNESASDLHITPNDKPKLRVRDKIERISTEEVLHPEDTYMFVKDLFKIRYDTSYESFFLEYINGKKMQKEITLKKGNMIWQSLFLIAHIDVG